MLTLSPWFALFAAAVASPPPDNADPPKCDKASSAISRALSRHAVADQRERKKRLYDGMAERDAERLAFVMTQLNAATICRERDAFNAGIILQHGEKPPHFLAGWHLFSWSCQQGREDACSWAALAWDRHLVSQGKPQWYGSQFQGQLDPDTGEHLGMCLVELESGCTDAERLAAGRPVLAEVVSGTYLRNQQETPPKASLKTLAEAGLICKAEPW